MKRPAIVGAIVLDANVTSICDTMNCANLAYTLHHQNRQLNHGNKIKHQLHRWYSISKQIYNTV